MRYCAFGATVNLRYLLLAVALGFASFGVATNFHKSGHITSASLPTPLCNPDDNTCGLGGGN
jgi:hypothetical protein